jgi:hypothetical protein
VLRALPCVHAVATTPAQRRVSLTPLITPPYQPSLKTRSGGPARCPFRGLLVVHSRYGLHTRAVTVFRDTLSEGFSHFVTSIAAPVASGWSVRPVGFAPTRRRLVTAHGHTTQTAVRGLNCSGANEPQPKWHRQHASRSPNVRPRWQKPTWATGVSIVQGGQAAGFQNHRPAMLIQHGPIPYAYQRPCQRWR